MVNFGSLSLLMFVIHYATSTVGGKDRQKLCAACHVIVDEIEHEISIVDPNKILEVAGFRVDPSGNQNNKKVKYARSETHLTEVTEKLCEKMNQYAKSTNKETGEVKYVLTSSRDGEPVSIDNVTISPEESEKLKHMCESIIEDNEENIIEYFKTPTADAKKFCSVLAGLCDDEEEEDAKEEL